MPEKKSFKKIFDNLYLIDLTPPELELKFISGYLIDLPEDIILVEPGPKSTTNAIFQSLSSYRLDKKLINIFITHLHLDHSGGAGTILNKYLNSKAYVHPKGAKHLLNPEKLWRSSLDALGWVAEIYGKPDPVPGHKLVITEDRTSIEMGDAKFTFIHTEGHASHHQSIYWHEINGLFVGDAAGIYIKELDFIIPTTLFPVKLDLYLKSLDKMMQLKPRYLFYPHYGVVKNGYNILKKHKKQVLEWYNLAVSNKIDNVKDYLKILIDTDKKFSEFISKTRDIHVVRILVDFSLMGILSAAIQ